MIDVTPEFIRDYLESAVVVEWDICDVHTCILAMALRDVGLNDQVKLDGSDMIIDGEYHPLPDWYVDYLVDMGIWGANKMIVDKQTSIERLQRYL